MGERPYFEQWLDPAERNAESLAWVLRPFRAETMRGNPASPLVNSPHDDEVRCLEPAVWDEPFRRRVGWLLACPADGASPSEARPPAPLANGASLPRPV